MDGTLPALPIADPRFADAPARVPALSSAHGTSTCSCGARKARAGYEEFLRRCPAHPATDHVPYDLEMLQLSQLRDGFFLTIVTFGQLLERFPRTVWEEEADLPSWPRTHVMANHCVVAADLYRRAAATEGGDREDAKSQLRRLACG